MPFNINDSIPPDSAPKTIIGALNALASQIKAITGGDSWKTTPSTSINVLHQSSSTQNNIFESNGTVNQLNDLMYFKNGASILKIQAERSNQYVDKYWFNWFPDTILNPPLSPAGVYLGYHYGNSQIGLKDTGVSFSKNGLSVCDIQSYPNQFYLLIPEYGQLRMQQPGGAGNIFQWSPYQGVRLYGSSLFFQAAENIGTVLLSPNPSLSALSVVGANGQSANLISFKDALNSTKLAISNDFKIDFSGDTNTPTNTTAVVGWIEVKIDGETSYIPAYR